MIYNMNLGSRYEGETTPWIDEVINGRTFISRDDIGQKIKVIGLDRHDPYLLQKFGDGQVLPHSKRWVNNNHTLGSILIPSKPPKKAQEDQDETIVYITLDDTYKLLQYKSNYEILQTYGVKGKYVGCALVIPPNRMKENEANRLMELHVKNVEINRYQVIKIDLDPTNGILSNIQEDVNNKKLVSQLKGIDKKNPNGRKFKFYVFGDKMLTSVYFVSNDEEYKVIDCLTSHIKNRKIVKIKEGMSEEELKKLCYSSLVDEHVRGFTMVGKTDIPYEIWNYCKQLYVFRWDMEKKRLICMKSN